MGAALALVALIGEVAVEDGLVVVAEDGAVEAADAGADAAEDAADGAVVDDGADAEAAEEAGQAAAEGAVEEFANLTNLARIFIKITTTLSILGGLVYSVYEVIKKQDSTPENEVLKALLAAVATALYILKETVKDWGKWMNQHVDDRSKYGTVQFEGTNIERYDLLDGQLNTLVDDLHTKLTPAIKSLTDTPTNANASNVRQLLIQVCNDFLNISNAIKTDETAMVADGLNDNQDLINAALNAISNSPVPNFIINAALAAVPNMMSRERPTPGRVPAVSSVEALKNTTEDIRAYIPKLRRQVDESVLVDFLNNLVATVTRLKDSSAPPLLLEHAKISVRFYYVIIKLLANMTDWLLNNTSNTSKYGFIKPGLETFQFVNTTVKSTADALTRDLEGPERALAASTSTFQGIDQAFADCALAVTNGANNLVAQIGVPALQPMLSAGFPGELYFLEGQIKDLTLSWNRGLEIEISQRRAIKYLQCRAKTPGGVFQRHQVLNEYVASKPC